MVPAALTLNELHSVLQTAMGWTDSHLHSFDIGGLVYGDADEFDGPAGNEARHRLSAVIRSVTRFRYDYDFGDGWEHDVVIEQALPASVIASSCLAGRRACPPEDCGGPSGYRHLLDVLADSGHEEHRELADWVGRSFDPEDFDVIQTNERLHSLAR